MAIDGMKVIDLDSHLVGDLESWEQTIEERWKPFLPKKLPTKENERKKTLIGSQIMLGSELGRHKSEKNEWYKPQDLTAHGRVRNMDLDGIDVAVLSPNSPALDILWFVDDPELASAYARAQNNYMNDYASQQPGRLMWAGVIPLQDPELAIKELHRSKEMGSKALNVKATPIPGKEWWDPYFNPIFKELQELKMPIIFHDTKTGSMGADRFADNFFFSHMVGRTIETMVCLMVYICGGVLEKFPGLKIICLGDGLTPLGFFTTRASDRSGSEKHKDFQREQKKSSRGKRHRTLTIRALSSTV
jgi:predicted TIM-barrel fold metal-dependent hydrolase